MVTAGICMHTIVLNLFVQMFCFETVNNVILEKEL